MKLSDIEFSCKCISNISAIPVRLYDENKLILCFGLENMPIDPVAPYENTLLSFDDSISYYCTPFYQLFGVVRCDKFKAIFGPVGITVYSQQEKRNYAFSLGISLIDFDILLTAMKQIPAFTPDSFINLLLLINFNFNGTKKDLTEVTPYMQIRDDRVITSRQYDADTVISNDSDTPPHNTRVFEKEMLNLIREGDVNGLKHFFSNRIPGRVGILSNDQVRQQKNMFIVAATLISRAAMDGGLYEDEAYKLSDIYIRRCEELFSIDAIMQLSYEMAVDFAGRVFLVDSRTSLSPFVASVVTFIRSNISSDLSCTALSKHFSIHRNQLNNKIKEETGKTISEFVMQEKIRRAKSLLTNTDKELSEIAEYLGFSSQSHFQTVFKKHTNQTLKEYRDHF